MAKRFSARNIALLLLTAAFMVGAYFLTDTLLYGVEAAIGSVVGNCVQGAAMLAGGVVILPIYCSLPERIRGIRK